MPAFTLNKNKALNGLLFICNRLGGAWDMYSLLKILYFAEYKHLLKYGRPITGDAIIAMKHGPVPSYAYNSVKSASINKEYFDFEDNIIVAKKQPDVEIFSQSELDCIEESIDENKHLSFGDLKKKSHENAAYQKAVRDSQIPYVELAAGGGASEEFLQYITTKLESDDFE